MENTIKLDLGCSKKKTPGYTGVDREQYGDVDVICDLTKAPWPWEDGSVDEVVSTHLVEHLDGDERITFFNELYRVMKTSGKVQIIVPIWSHERAYGDPTHKWPPITPWSFYYLSKQWRDSEAPHVKYTCDFDYSLIGVHAPEDPWLAGRNQETKGILMNRNINTTTDIIATLTKKK